MNGGLVSRISWRYLRGKRGGNAVPILSRIAMASLGVGCAALIILFSVFNGFELVLRDLYKAFYPDIRITAAKGKFFDSTALPVQQVRNLKGIAASTAVAEDNAFVNRDEDQVVVLVKGVNNDYFHVNDVKQYIENGRDSFKPGPVPLAIIGSGIASQLGLDVNNDFSRMLLHYPNAEAQNAPLSPEDAYQSLQLKPDGSFRVQEDFDNSYVLAPLALVQSLLHQEGRWSSYEIKLQPGASEQKLKADLQKIVGPDFKVETQYEQNSLLYGVMRSEKWATFAILLFVLLIASVNLIGALLLLVLEKKKDAAIMVAMGATPGFIRNVFLAEGMLWAGLGGIGGLLIGCALCFGQMQWGWISMGENFIIESYPVRLQFGDVLVVLATVIGVGLLAAWYPAVRASRVNAGGLRSS